MELEGGMVAAAFLRTGTAQKLENSLLKDQENGAANEWDLVRTIYMAVGHGC